MKAIQTKYHGPTNYRGARITATAGSNRVTLSYDHALNSDDNHDAAALALCAKLGWTKQHLMRGTLESPAGASLGNVYTFEDRQNRVSNPAGWDTTPRGKYCYRCGGLIMDAEYQVENEGTVRHLNACPS